MRRSLLAPFAVLAAAPLVRAVPAWFPRGFSPVSAAAPGLRDYLAREALEFPGAEHRMGTVRVDGLEVACHLWIPAHPRGTAFLVHGYYDHSGTWSPHVGRFLSEGRAVAAFDLPGHGLSDGRRDDIDSIGQYARALSALEDSQRALAPRPWSLVGHSLGGLVVLDRARRPAYPYATTVLVAPLVHYSEWGWSGPVLPLLSLVRSELPRSRPPNSSADTSFLRRIQDDPLEGWTTSLRWLSEVRRWNASMQGARLAPTRWFLLQGDQDATVDWRYDMAWARSHLPGLRARIFPGGGHHLHNEGGWIGRAAREALDSAIAGGLPGTGK